MKMLNNIHKAHSFSSKKLKKKKKDSYETLQTF